MRSAALRALARRDFRRYFGNPTGYVFITLFILLSAAAAFWRPRFFLDNLATLDQLNEVFPYLLVLFVAALTMGVWADERRQGTDELILTLPARDVEIVAGKYLAVVGIYTLSLLVSLSHVVVLFWLGRPDLGLLAANYVGYWFAGAALIAVGMAGSMMTTNATIAFILAAFLCSVPVLCGAAAALFVGAAGSGVARLGLPERFQDFAGGVISGASILYFVSLAALFLYINVVMLGRRHWPERDRGVSLSDHHAVRIASLAAALAAVTMTADRISGLRVDMTAGRVHSLSPETRRLVTALPADRPVTVHAFVSPEMPPEYVQQRENVLNTLREIQALAGSKVDVQVEDTTPYSDQARRARERFGIVPRLVADVSSTATERLAVFLGVGVTSGADEQVIPFFERGLSAEYELTRAIRVVSRSARKRLGVIDSDAKAVGGVDFESGRTRLPWAIVGELRRQYDVVPIAPYDPIHERLDAMLVLLPSTLLQRELDHVFDVIRAGVPALLVVDPVPAVDMRLAPAAHMAVRMNPYANTEAFARKNVGDILKAMSSIGVEWPAARVAWDRYRPRPETAQLPPEVVFVSAGSGNASAFNRRHPVTAGLQNMTLPYPGYLSAASGADGFTFEPLLQTGPQSGTASYFQVVQPGPAGPVLNVNLPHAPEGKPLTLAAHVRSKSINAIVVADLDFISDQVFAARADDASADVADNVTFLVNAIDVLAADDSFVALRSRRVHHPTLERVEAQMRTFIERRQREELQAAAEAQAAIDAAQHAFEQRLREIDARPDLDAQARQVLARNVEETERRKLGMLRANIELAKNAKIQASREAMEASILTIQRNIRATAVLAPPAPMLLIGLLVFLRQRRRERAPGAAQP